jgi:hypothetical protein
MHTAWHAAVTMMGGAGLVGITVFGCVAAFALALALAGLAQLGIPDAVQGLREEDPEAIVHRVYGESAFARGIRRLADRRWMPRPAAFLILVIRADGIEFWTADTTAAPLVRIPTDGVTDAVCRTASNDGGFLWPTLFVTVRGEAHAKPVVLPFVILRETGRRFLPVTLGEAETAVENLRSALRLTQEPDPLR